MAPLVLINRQPHSCGFEIPGGVLLRPLLAFIVKIFVEYRVLPHDATGVPNAAEAQRHHLSADIIHTSTGPRIQCSQSGGGLLAKLGFPMVREEE